MTEPSQYFKGRTVQEQMNEVIGYVDQRSAEVATAAIASDVAQVHQDMLDADADAQAAAASAAAAAGTLANAVKKTGESSQSIAGDITVSGTLSGGVVTGTQITVPTPVNNTDAANKKYVDDADALKADKTYVDAQDALKVNITDINTYALGLTGNQTASGLKSGRFSMKEMTVSIPQPATNGKYRKLYTIKNAGGNLAIAGRFQDCSNAQNGFYGDFIAVIRSADVVGKISGIAFGGYNTAELFFGYDGTDVDVWVKDAQYRPKQVKIENLSIYGTLQSYVIDTDGATIIDDYTTYKVYTVAGGITQ